MDQFVGAARLEIDSAYYNSLDIQSFTKMLKDPSYCYKFYWLEAIVNLISEGVEETNFGQIIDEMICSAWYSVREFHIHLSGIGSDGSVRDGLERAIQQLAELSSLPANASKVEILNEIKRCESRLNKEVRFHPDWIRMFQDNTVAILGWIQYEKVRWLQNNNPEVPGLVYKLAPMDERLRKLNRVRKLWEGVIACRQVRDVFTGQPVRSREYDIDHFIPWSFVMNDELWNLMPMDSSLNSAKSNRLPQWDPFFRHFAGNQYILYLMIQEKPEIRKLYEGCWKDNLHSIWAGQELYRPGNSQEVFSNILEKNMRPVYDSAMRQGYEVWKMPGRA